MSSYLIVSDSHGDLDRFIQIVEEQPTLQTIYHLGDGASDVRRLKKLYPEKEIIGVAGNNDWSEEAPEELLMEVESYRVYLTHGHLYGVKRTLNTLAKRGLELGADIVLYGHTHIAKQSNFSNLSLFNPGSCHRSGNPEKEPPSYGILTLSETGVTFTLHVLGGVE